MLGLVDTSIQLTVKAETSAEATARELRDTLGNTIEVQDLEKDFFTLPIGEVRCGIPIAKTGLAGRVVYENDGSGAN